MRRVIVFVLLAILAVVALPAPMAQAATHGKDCATYLHWRPAIDNYEGVEVCVMVNVHDFLGINEGLARVGSPAPGYQLVGDLDVYVDSLKLFRNGNVVQKTNPDRWYTNVGGDFERSTDWNMKCYPHDGDYQAEFLFKLRFSDGDVMGPYYKRSNHWTDPDDCPI